MLLVMPSEDGNGCHCLHHLWAQLLCRSKGWPVMSLDAMSFHEWQCCSADTPQQTGFRAAGGASGDPIVCGAMTSGGTESILSAVKASRDYMRAKRGIREPEMIIANSAHAAFFKAAEFFKIRLIKVLSNATLMQSLLLFSSVR